MTRGVLIDVACTEKCRNAAETYVISADDLQQALAKEKVTLQPGDAVMITQGGASFTMRKIGTLLKTSPGIGIAAGSGLIKQNPNACRGGQLLLEVRRIRAES